jgi:esterase/lipase superfamily enzyme
VGGFKITVYVSPDDKALATSGWLFGSIVRLGSLHAATLTPEQTKKIGELGFIDIIQISGTTDFFGHGYFRSNPRVSADLMAMIRYGLGPNEPGRPLEEVKRPFWRVPEPGANSRAGGAD